MNTDYIEDLQTFSSYYLSLLETQKELNKADTELQQKRSDNRSSIQNSIIKMSSLVGSHITSRLTILENNTVVIIRYKDHNQPCAVEIYKDGRLI